MRLTVFAALLLVCDGASLPLVSRHPGPPVPPPPSPLACAGTNTSRNGITFLGRCFCEPGWLGHYCDEPLRQHGHCECKPDDYVAFRNFSKELSHPKGYICEALCHWNAEVGCPRTIAGEWKWNQLGKQLHFYQDRLPRKRRNTDLVGRLIEFAEGYEQFRALNHTHLGHVIEFGCGGYTQTRNIMEHVDVRVDSVTLVDPMIKDYQKIARCSFGNGTLLGIMNTTLVPSTVESYGARFAGGGGSSGRNSSGSGSGSGSGSVAVGGRVWPQYDTVIDMNVLVYAQDAFKFLETLHRSLKVGGLLVFHERWFENHVKSSKCKVSGFEVNVIQVGKTLLDHFLSHYSRAPFYSTNQTRDQVLPHPSPPPVSLAPTRLPLTLPRPSHSSSPSPLSLSLSLKLTPSPPLTPLPSPSPSGAAVPRLVLHVRQRAQLLDRRAENQGVSARALHIDI